MPNTKYVAKLYHLFPGVKRFAPFSGDLRLDPGTGSVNTGRHGGLPEAVRPGTGPVSLPDAGGFPPEIQGDGQ